MNWHKVNNRQIIVRLSSGGKKRAIIRRGTRKIKIKTQRHGDTEEEGRTKQIRDTD